MSTSHSADKSELPNTLGGVDPSERSGADQVTARKAKPAPKAPADDDMPLQQRYYAAAVGKRKRDYYLRSFARFDRNPLRVSWNGSAFLISLFWLLYRRMWGVALFHACVPLVLFLIIDLVAVNNRDMQFALLILYLIYAFLLLPMAANGLYYRFVRERINRCEARYSDPVEVEAALARHGGGSGWIAFLLFAGISGGIAASGYLLGYPFYKTYVAQTKVDIGYELAQVYQERVTDYVKEQGMLPTSMAELGEPVAIFYDHIEAVSLGEQSQIGVRFTRPDQIAGRSLYLVPTLVPAATEQGKPTLKWRCEAPNIEQRYLPKSCGR